MLFIFGRLGLLLYLARAHYQVFSRAEFIYKIFFGWHSLGDYEVTMSRRRWADSNYIKSLKYTMRHPRK